MALSPDVKKVIDNVPQLLERIGRLTGSDVLVGIPQEKSPRRDGTSMNNATLAYIHENGSPAQNIPARPFIAPGIKRIRKDAIAMLKQAAKDALQGRDTVKVTLGRVGMMARNSVVEAITNPQPEFEPLKPATIRARLRRTKAGRRQLQSIQRKAQASGTSTSAALSSWAGAGNIRPLIDTAQLRNSITYVVR